MHHEKWDGSGYPRKLQAGQIAMEARIAAVADVFDVLNSHRPYRPAHSADEAIRIIRAAAANPLRSGRLCRLPESAPRNPRRPRAIRRRRRTVHCPWKKPAMNRILFVDDELGGARRVAPHAPRHARRVGAGVRRGGAEALERCAARTFDVVVLRRPDAGHGRTRPVERSHAAPAGLRPLRPLRPVPLGPGDPQRGRSASVLEQALRSVEPDLRGDARATSERHFPDLAARKAVSCVAALPSQPTAYAELVNRVKSARASIESATEIIARDVALTAKAVHLAGSGFFSGPKHVSSSAAAVNLLGLKTITALLQSPDAFSGDCADGRSASRDSGC